MADASLVGLLLRLAVSMGVVIGLMLLAAKVLRRSAAGMGIGRGPKVKRMPINVSALQPLTRNASVAIVRAGGRELVVGVTEHQVTLLHSSIEPRDAVEDLDGDACVVDEVGDARASNATTTTDVLLPPTASARIAPAVAADSLPRELPSGLSAWTDALETLREKTVRR